MKQFSTLATQTSYLSLSTCDFEPLYRQTQFYMGWVSTQIR
jgi:hypothetical protein